jgi:pre-rRNA-processing protein TSR3
MVDVKILVLLLHEDDPSKNTALKMIRSGLATPVNKYNIRGHPVVLNPYSQEYFGPWLREQVSKHGILVLDASWRKLNPVKFKFIRGIHVKLPPLLPGNPVNYGKPCMLSSIEAVAAALYITGFHDIYEKLIGLFKWMSTFNDLNINLLQSYFNVRDINELLDTIIDYWGTINPCYITNST